MFFFSNPFCILKKLSLISICNCADDDIITIGKNTGQINVNAIDRDARKNEFYPFEVKL